MGKFLKMFIIGLGILGIVGCSKVKDNGADYLRCNDTSSGFMAETKTGYFMVKDSALFYADKEDLTNWVKVCNKPDCMHMALDSSCHANLPSHNRIIQKNGKLYGIDDFIEERDGIYVFEIATDGSGIKKVYELPKTKEVDIRSFGRAEFLNRFLVYYGYLNENGMRHKQLLSVEEDENDEFQTYTLYEEVAESGGTFLLEGSSYWSIRGDDLMITSAKLEEGDDLMTTLWRVDDKLELEKINLPSDINLLGGYLSGNIFSYYEKNEGFYELNLTTGEKTLVSECQMEDGCGWIFSEEYRIECNRYDGNKPDEAYLKFYNGKEWVDIELPEEIANCDSAFYPMALTSDRIFYQHGAQKGSQKVTDWYYFMIEEEKPELVYIGLIGEELEEESSSETSNLDEETNTDENASTEHEESGRVDFEAFQPIVVFDNENYYLEITDVYLQYPYDSSTNTYFSQEKRYYVEMHFENKRDIKYMINGSFCAINGIQCNTSWGKVVDEKDTETIQLTFTDDMLDTYQISNIYEKEQFTDIEIGFSMTGMDIKNGVMTVGEEEKYVHVYPYGEEQVVSFTRELKDTDNVLVDNENIMIAVTGYDEEFVSNDTINVVIQNKTDKRINVLVEKAWANGVKCAAEDSYEGLYSVVVNPNKYVTLPMTLFNSCPESDVVTGLEPTNTFFTKNHITKVEEMKMELRAYPCDISRVEIGEDLYEATITLKP